MKKNSDIDWFVGLAGLMVSFAVAGLLEGVRSRVGETNVALLLGVVVLCAGLTGGRRGGVVTAFGAALSFNFFHTVPIHSLRIDAGRDVLTVALLAVFGLIVGELAQRRGQAAEGTRLGRAELRLLHRNAEVCRSATTANEAVIASTAAVVDLLGAESAFFQRTPHALRDTDARIAHDGTIEGLPLRATPDGYDLGTSPVRLEVGTGDRVFGHLLITPTPGHMGSLDARTGAVVVADQLAMALVSVSSRSGAAAL